MEEIRFLDYKTNRYVGPMSFFYKWGSGTLEHSAAKVFAIIQVKQPDRNNSNLAAIKKLVAIISDKHCREVLYSLA